MAQCPTGYVGRLFWPCSHFSGFMGNGQNLWHPVHFCLEGRGHSAISYRTTGFPRLFLLFFQLPLAASALSLSLSCILQSQYQRGFSQIPRKLFANYFYRRVLCFFKKSFFFFFFFPPLFGVSRCFFVSIISNVYVWVNLEVDTRKDWGILKVRFENLVFRLGGITDRSLVQFQTFAISFHVWVKPK